MITFWEFFPNQSKMDNLETKHHFML